MNTPLSSTEVFLVIAVVASVLGSSMEGAKILFWVDVTLLLLTLVGRVREAKA